MTLGWKVAGILMRLILQGIVAYILKKAAVGSTRGAINTVGAVRNVGMEAAAEESVAGLVGKLRASKLGNGFADWVESNWRNLMEDPRFRPKEMPKLESTEVTPKSEGRTKESAKPKQEQETTKTPKEIIAQRKAAARSFIGHKDGLIKR